ncbi:MAG: circularly permuted type 2 ATP-grasp protein [Ilumatobacteraceae bacterium]
MDELLEDDGSPRAIAHDLIDLLHRLGLDELRERQRLSELEILTMGISFTVYSDGENIDRAWPFDIIPRLIDGHEWAEVQRGLAQRLRALNRFIDDIYNDQNIIRDGIFPAELLEDSTNYRPECQGIRPKFGVWAHISGSDLVRGGDGRFYVLEDNLRVPSGVSYVLENRVVAKRTFPELFERHLIRPVDGYTDELNKLLSSLAPEGRTDPTIVVLTPGIFNSAYFEHSFLAQRMGAEVVEGDDLVVDDDDIVHMKTITGLERVDVIYRRIDDLFLDPEVFLEDSMLGVPGLMRAWKAGNVGIANAPGAGVADDKCVYAWVPDMIRYYLGEEPLIANVPTFRCMYDDEREHVLANLSELVLKPANESGGYGILIGNRATEEELEAAADAVRADPRNWVAQPILDLSTAPTLVEDGIEPRHLDLRPFVLTGEHSYVTAGGLTRVALTKGSLVVNSSQGGGSKDTWIVDGPNPHRGETWGRPSEHRHQTQSQDAQPQGAQSQTQRQTESGSAG